MFPKYSLPEIFNLKSYVIDAGSFNLTAFLFYAFTIIICYVKMFTEMKGGGGWGGGGGELGGGSGGAWE